MIFKTSFFLKAVLISCGFICLTFIYYHAFSRVPKHTDDANMFLAGADMAGGNWRLHGWWLAVDNFWTLDISLYALLIKLLGPNPKLMLLLPALLWASISVASLLFAGSGLKERQKALAMLAVATPILLPVIPGNGGMLQIAHAPMHIETILGMLLCFALLGRAMCDEPLRVNATLCAYTILMIVLIIGDPWAILFGALPVIVFAAFCLLFRGRNKRLWIAIGSTILAVLIAKFLVGANCRTGGFEEIPMPSVFVRFVSFDEFGKSIAVCLHHLFTLFGCDFFGRALSLSPSAGPILPLVRLPFLILFAGAFIKVGAKFFSIANTSLESLFLDALLAIAVVINIAASIFSAETALDPAGVRYLFPSLVFGSILIGRNGLHFMPIGIYYCFAAFLSAVLLGIICWGELRSDSHNKSLLYSENVEMISRWLARNQLTEGFGSYWSSSIITVATKNHVRVRAVRLGPNDTIIPFRWENRRDWYRQTDNSGKTFILVEDTGGKSLPEQQVVKFFGEPAEKHQVGPYTVDVYPSENPQIRSLSVF